jgi:hypothetical protein
MGALCGGEPPAANAALVTGAMPVDAGSFVNYEERTERKGAP